MATLAQSFQLARAAATDAFGLTKDSAATVYAQQSGTDSTQAVTAQQAGLFDGATGIAQQLADAIKSALWRVTLILALLVAGIFFLYLTVRRVF